MGVKNCLVFFNFPVSRARPEKNCVIFIGYNPGGRGGYSHTLPIRVCAAQRGRDFEAPDLERGIKNCGSRLYLLLKIVADYEEAFI